MSKGTRFITTLAGLAVLGTATAAVALAATIIGTHGPDNLTGTPRGRSDLRARRQRPGARPRGR